MMSISQSDVTIGQKGSVIYPQPLVMDLSTQAKVIKSSIPFGLRRVIMRGNNALSPSSSKAGIFVRSDNDILSDQDFLTDFVLDNKNFGKCRGLQEIELSSLNKMVPASGVIPFSYFLDAAYPFKSKNTPFKFDSDVISSIASIFGDYINSNFTEEEINSCRPSQFHSAGVPVNYKLHSSYGCFPYVPGSHPASSIALQWHVCNARFISKSLSKKTSSVDIVKIVSDSYDACSARSNIYMRHPWSSMFLTRARPVGISRPIPKWEVNFLTKTLTATGGTYGFNAAARIVIPVTASCNLPLTRIAQLFTMWASSVTGLHVGGLWLSYEVLLLCVTEWGFVNLDIHVEDIKNFDWSVLFGHFDSVHDILRHVFGLSDSDVEYMEWVNNIPIAMCDMFDFDSGDYTLLNKEGGLSSGHQLTTLYGTLINLMTKLQSMKIVLGSMKEVIRTCANFSSITKTKISDCKWGFMIKGDDLILFWNKSVVPLIAREMASMMKDMGFTTTVEPGPIFLMIYADLTSRVKGSSNPACPPKWRDSIHIRTFGIATRRIAHRSIFVEHPLNDIRPARLSILSNCDDLTFHPGFESASAYLISILNRIDTRSVPWTLSSLRKHVNSSAGRLEMQEYGATQGGVDKFLVEYTRKYSHYVKGGDIEVDGDMNYIDDLFLDMKMLIDLSIDDLSELENDNGASYARLVYDPKQSQTQIASTGSTILNKVYKHLNYNV